MTRAEAAVAVAGALSWWARRYARRSRGRTVSASEVATALRAGLCRATARAAAAAFGVTCNHGADVLDCRPCLEALCVQAGEFNAAVKSVPT